MATSGTYDFNLDIAEIVEEAYELCGLEARVGYDYRTARRSLNLLMLEWQNRGLNLWTVKNDTLTLIAGQSAYPLSAERVDVIEAQLRQPQVSTTGCGTSTSGDFDIHMKPISVSNYARISHKQLLGRPIQYWIEKGTDEITLNVWPVPDRNGAYTMNYYYLQRVQDVGSTASNTLSMPSRFLPVVTAGLAYYISMKKAPEKSMGLKSVYDEQWNLAADSDRNKASFFVKPGGYRNL